MLLLTSVKNLDFICEEPNIDLTRKRHSTPSWAMFQCAQLTNIISVPPNALWIDICRPSFGHGIYE